MAPSTANGSTPANGRAGSAQTNGSHASASQAPATDSQPMEPPPAKKRRLKLSVRNPKSNESPGDTIAVSRPKRDVKPRYSQDVIMTEDEDLEVESTKPAKPASPAPSSGLSSLSSAPPSPPREESPFKDPSPPPTGNEDYGDFMAYYIAPGDDEPQPKPPKSKANSRSKAKPRTSKVEPAKKSKQSKQPAPPSKAKTAAPPTAAPPSVPPQPQYQVPPPQAPPTNHQRAPQHHNAPPRPQNVPPPYPSGPPQGIQRPPPPMPPPPMPQSFPQPVIQFIDVAYCPKPSKPDTIAEMIKKLQELSSALTDFGGVPAVPHSPQVQPAKKLAPATSNPLDGFLSLFGGDDEESEEKSEGKPEEKELDYVQPNPGNPDAPLSYGIQFIQNALKSWAQQRMTHQITQQLQAQHQQLLHEQHMNQQRRGPGRPRKFDDPLPGQPGGPPPVIQMNLADTPEGVAIKSFQSILDSGCLQVNAPLHADFSRALRHLYMQIDHLINQGTKANDAWQCMSYGAQISAHRVRVEKWKEAQARAQEEMARQQEIIRQQLMAQMGIDPNAPMNDVQLQHAHALELERRRSMQHAAQQPYISQQHLNPLQLGSQPPRGPDTSNGTGPSPSPALSNDGPNTRPQSVLPSNENATPGTPSEQPPNGVQINPATGMAQTPSSFNKGAAAQVQLDKMKLYMPGFLPRSGQSMKFSFAPHNEAAVRAFGPEAFPPDQPQGYQLPNRGPMSAPPASNGIVQPLTDTPMPDAQPTMIDLTSDEPAPQEPQPSSRPKTSNGITGGFTAVNKPASAPAVERPASVPAGSPIELSPETIKVYQKQPARVASVSGSPVVSNKMNWQAKRAEMASRFPHPGAIVVDE